MDKVVVTIPYNLTVAKLQTQVEDDCDHWADSLEWIATECENEEEAKRILTAAVLLTQVGHGLSVALHSAIVYERG
jgi:hypothetical protein